MTTLLVALGVTGAVWLALVALLLIAGRRSAARDLAMLVPNLLVLFRGLLRDPRVPRRSKALILFALVWIASPIDLVPEFIPVAGPLDDAIVAGLVLRRLLRAGGREVVSEHWRGSPDALRLLLRLGGAAKMKQP